MDKTLLSRQDLAERWGLTVKTIEKYETDGIISRVKGIPTPRYSLESVSKIEGLEELNPMSPTERKKLERKINSLENELNVKNELLKKYSLLSVETLDLIKNY